MSSNEQAFRWLGDKAEARRQAQDVARQVEGHRHRERSQELKDHRKVLNLDGAKQGRHFDDSTQRSASNECVRLIRKLRWIGMDDEAERVLAQLSGWPFRLTEIGIAGQWATD
jgi:hypothetical protein